METVMELSSQWANPSDVTTVLMVIGGDVVQKALAQSTGRWFTPVCLSFGWVSYAFMSIVSVVGEGRLLPPPDYPVKVVNLETGYSRENRNWVLGRVLRDHEAWISRSYPLADNSIRISVLEATQNPMARTEFSFSQLHLYGLAAMALQLIVAAIPVILTRDWGILLVTGAGTLLALAAGALPQWRAEKLPNRQDSYKTIALTTGNGAKDIMVIKGLGWCLDLEELAGADSPRHSRPWEKFLSLSESTAGTRHSLDILKRAQTGFRIATSFKGLPVGFRFTQIVCGIQSILWLLLLISVSALKSSSWYLIIVGAIGMFQNAVIAGMERDPRHRNLPLALDPPLDVIRTKKVMDGLMDLEVSHRCGQHLVDEFFPNKQTDAEVDWWRGQRTAYDNDRCADGRRGMPRSRMPDFQLPHVTKPRESSLGKQRGLIPAAPEPEVGATRMLSSSHFSARTTTGAVASDPQSEKPGPISQPSSIAEGSSPNAKTIVPLPPTDTLADVERGFRRQPTPQEPEADYRSPLPRRRGEFTPRLSASKTGSAISTTFPTSTIYEASFESVESE